MHAVVNNDPFDDDLMTHVHSETLGPSGVNDGDVLQLTRRQPVQQQGQGQGQQWGGFGDGQNPLRDIRAIKNDPVTMMHVRSHALTA